jgi:hypothetical protein
LSDYLSGLKACPFGAHPEDDYHCAIVASAKRSQTDKSTPVSTLREHELSNGKPEERRNQLQSMHWLAFFEPRLLNPMLLIGVRAGKEGLEEVPTQTSPYRERGFGPRLAKCRCRAAKKSDSLPSSVRHPCL